MGAEQRTPFAVDVNVVDDVAQIGATGELDIATAPQLESAISEAVSGGRAVALDLSGIEFIDSTGLRALVSGRGQARDAGTGFSLSATSTSVDRLLRVTGLEDEF